MEGKRSNMRNDGIKNEEMTRNLLHGLVPAVETKAGDGYEYSSREESERVINALDLTILDYSTRIET